MSGCVCSAAWGGNTCSQDVDECVDEEVCLLNQVCVNSIGSFKCACRDGYASYNGACEGRSLCS